MPLSRNWLRPLHWKGARCDELAAALADDPGACHRRRPHPRAKAALIYQHSDEERQEEVAVGLDATVRKAREEAAQETTEKRSGTDLARGR
ncbi:hypothetical protein SAFG77S_06350 [Streptomyces afghaniensis]